MCRIPLLPQFWSAKNYAFSNISITLLVLTLYFFATRLARIRFLNLKDHVALPRRIGFADLFRGIIDALGTVSNVAELKHVTSRFFNNAFGLPYDSIRLIILDETPIVSLSEAQLGSIRHTFANPKFVDFFLYQSRILIRDEVEFTAFYSDNPLHHESLELLRGLRTEILLPLHHKDTILGVLIIDHRAQGNRFFSDRERDEMLIFAAYLGPIINLLRNRNLEALLTREKQIEAELRWKHEEVNQYRESIRSFLRHADEQKFGILFYRQGKFIAVNESTKSLLGCDPNVQIRHPVAQTLKALVNKVSQYKTPHSETCLLKETREKVLFSAIHEQDKQSIVITITPPHIADLIKQHTTHLNDPSQWDYLLYLETTESGRLVNELIPGSGEKILNFKIELLKHALSQKPLLLNGPKEDVRAIVQLLHTISLRKKFAVIKLAKKEEGTQYAHRIFGINPLFLTSKTEHIEPPLLEQLHKEGTLYIENVQNLAVETQKQLSSYLRTGTYHPLKSEQRSSSNVRIICSVVDGNIDSQPCIPELLIEFRRATLAIPRLEQLDKNEFGDLLKGLTAQLTPEKRVSPDLFLPARETDLLQHIRPESICDLKRRIYGIVSTDHELKKTSVKTTNETENISDEEIQKIILLGKHALRDQHALETLWKKFKSQTKIATLLGVNRSSVNRRCREFGLED
ncbi:MAG: sigma 54-interacting transcriptional regulator [Candidatus Babeliaceae bacterium]|nr:sigma 54-interacting transcriptional regulator [Candidatus Babeliaceae bacterium]